MSEGQGRKKSAELSDGDWFMYGELLVETRYNLGDIQVLVNVPSEKHCSYLCCQTLDSMYPRGIPLVSQPAPAKEGGDEKQ